MEFMHSGSRAIRIKNPKEGPKKQPWRSISGSWPGSEQHLLGSAQLRVSLGRGAACFSRDQSSGRAHCPEQGEKAPAPHLPTFHAQHKWHPPSASLPCRRIHGQQISLQKPLGSPLGQPAPPRPQGPGHCSLFPVAGPLCNLRQFKGSHKRVRTTQYDKS